MRIKMEYNLAGASDTIQVDIGFGDAVVPQVVAYPSLLDLPALQIHAYPREAVVAEKYHAMVLLGISNSRMKDFFDVYVLAREFPFEGQALARAIAATFDRRSTAVPIEVPVALMPEFASDTAKRAQWQGFLRRSRLTVPAPDLADAITALRAFLEPPSRAIAGGEPFRAEWPAGGPWREA